MLKVGDKVKGFKIHINPKGIRNPITIYSIYDKYVGVEGVVHKLIKVPSYEGWTSSDDPNHFEVIFNDGMKLTYPISEYVTLQREMKLKELGIV